MSCTRRARGWVCRLALWAVLALASSARAADTARIERQLRVEPGATCLSAARLATEISQLLGDAPIADDFVLFVDGSASDSRVVHLRFVRQEGVVAERAFEPGPARCSHLHAAVALASVLAINAGHQAKPEVMRNWSLSGMGLWTYQLLPEFAPGAELSARRALGAHFLVRAGVLGVFATDARLKSLPGTFNATLIAARVEGCGRLELVSPLQIGGCIGMLGGMLHVRGENVTAPMRSTVPWTALSAALDLEFGISDRWSLLLEFSTTYLLHGIRVGFQSASGVPGESRELESLAFALGIGAVLYL